MSITIQIQNLKKECPRKMLEYINETNYDQFYRDYKLFKHDREKKINIKVFSGVSVCTCNAFLTISFGLTAAVVALILGIIIYFSDDHNLGAAIGIALSINVVLCCFTAVLGVILFAITGVLFVLAYRNKNQYIIEKIRFFETMNSKYFVPCGSTILFVSKFPFDSLHITKSFNAEL